MAAPSMTNRKGSATKALRLIKRFVIPCVSVVIIFIWSSQFLVSVPLSMITHEIKRSWPIVDYPMYSGPHFAGDKIPRMAVVGICDNAKEIDIRQEDVGGGYWYFQVFAKAVMRGDEAVIRDMVRIYESRHNVRLATLRVENRPLLWKSTQVESAPTEILRTYPLLSTQHNSDLP
jgi:hypothetical protein